jgi:peptidoglycan/LPS O-acetylase OafA/YrhL
LPTGLHLLGLPLLSGFPHLLGVFGLGMACAAILSFQWYTDNFRLWRIILVILGSVALIAFGFIAIFAPQIRYDPLTRWITDLLIAMACAAFILDLVTSKQQIGSSSSQKHPVLSFLELRPVLFLGAISYSLYLTHVVVWAMLGIFLGLAPVRRFISLSTDPFPIRLFVVIPLLILFAYLFYLVFEKPFLSSRKR